MFKAYYSHFTWCMRGSKGGGAAPWKITKLECFSNTDPDSLKITKLPSQHSVLSQHRPASEKLCHLNQALRGLAMGRFLWYLDRLSPHQPKKKKISLQSWTHSDKTFWIRAWFRTKVSGVVVSHIDKRRICSRHITPILHWGFMLLPCCAVYFFVSVLVT